MTYKESYPEFYQLAYVLDIPEKDICCDISGLNFALWHTSSSNQYIGISIQHSSSRNGVTLEVTHNENNNQFSESKDYPYEQIERLINIVNATERGNFSLSSHGDTPNELMLTVLNNNNTELLTLALKQRTVLNEAKENMFKRVTDWLRGSS